MAGAFQREIELSGIPLDEAPDFMPHYNILNHVMGPDTPEPEFCRALLPSDQNGSF